MFNAPVVEGNNAALTQTLQALDTLDGGAGTDVLNATLNDDAGAPSISNIEQFYFRSVHNDAEVDFAGVDGAEQIWSDRSTNNLTISNVQDAATVGMKGHVAGIFAVTYDADVLDSTKFEQVVVLDGVKAGTLNITKGGDDVITGLTITASGENTLTLGAGLNTVTALKISGAGDLKLTGGNDFTSIKTIAAGTATGDITINASNAVAGTVTSVVTGAGDDTVTLDEVLFRAATEATVNLGAGKDTLVLDGVGADGFSGLVFKGDDLAISGVETLRINGANLRTAADTLSTDGIAVNSLIFGNDITGAFGLTISKFAGSELTFKGDVVNAVTAADVKGALTITTEVGATGITTITLAEATSLTINAEAAFTAGTGITAAKITSLTVDTDDTGAVDLSVVTGAALTSTTASGKANFTVELAATTNKVTSIDLSGLTGDATIDLNAVTGATGAMTITVGEGGLAYTASTADAIRETFKFVGDDIGTVTIVGFTIGAGANADRLDLSALGITDVNDLVITGGANAEIRSANDEFDGVITLTGVADTDLSATNFLL